MKNHFTFFFLLIGLFVAITPQTVFGDAKIIAQLTRQISETTNEVEKSRLHIYRARNYSNLGDIGKAEKDYDAALAFDHKGWIHLERGKFYISNGDYEQAKKEAEAARKETPTLKVQADKLIVIADKKMKKDVLPQEQGQPKEILLTKRWTISSTVKKHVARSGNLPRSSVRKAYAKRNKKRATSKPRRVARS